LSKSKQASREFTFLVHYISESTKEKKNFAKRQGLESGYETGASPVLPAETLGQLRYAAALEEGRWAGGLESSRDEHNPYRHDIFIFCPSN